MKIGGPGLFSVAALIVLAACGGETSGDGDVGSGGSGGAGDAGDAGEVGSCPPMPGPMDCVDPCTDQMYGPSCVDGQWTCERTVPDGGCPGPFACGELTCEGDQICMHAQSPGICPDPDAGICPAGCPGCEPLPGPTCEPLPSACSATPTCECVLQVLCHSAGTCDQKSGGIEVACQGA